MRVEKERELRGEDVDAQAGLDRRLHVRDAVGERERNLLHRGAPGLAHVIAGDRDRVPARHALLAVREGVGDQPHRGAGREDVGSACDVLLEDVVLHGPAEPIGRDALAARGRHVEREQDGRGRVDRHRGRDAVERNALEEIVDVLERGDGHADLARLATRHRRVGIVAHLGRQIEGHRETGLSLLEQEAVALVRLDRGPEAGVLPHGPQAFPMHLGVHAPGERKLPGRAELRGQAVGRGVLGPVDGLQRLPPRRLELLRAVRHRGRLPCFLGGLLSRLLRRSSSTSQSRARVSLGSMTSSM